MRKVYQTNEDMSLIATITKDGSREPTKWEVLRLAYHMLRYSRGKGSARKVLISAFAKLRAAPWKASHASWLNDTMKAPDAATSARDTE